MDPGTRAAGAGTGGTRPPVVKRLEELLIGLRKSSKDLAFYPHGHPALDRSVERALGQLHAVLDTNTPLTLAVTRTGFSFEGRPVGAENRQLTPMAAELFVKRIQKIFFAEGVEAEELAAFLRMISSDPKQLVQQGGPGKVLATQGVRRIQVNEFDFQRLGMAPGPTGRAAGPGDQGRGGAGGPGTGGGAQAPGERGSAGGIGTAPGLGPATSEGGPGLASTAQGIGIESAGGIGGTTGRGGDPSPPGAEISAVGGMPAALGALLSSLGPQEALAVEALIQRLEREAASGGPAGYDWVASKLETAADQAVKNGCLGDLLAILRVFLLHQQEDGPAAPPLRERAAQALATVAAGDTVAYLVKHLGSSDEGLEADLVAVLLGLGSRAIRPLLDRLAAENQAENRGHLVATLAQFGEAALPGLSEAMKTADRDLACDLATILGRVGGEASVALLARLTRHEEAPVRTQAVRGLGHVGSTSAHRLLVQALRDSDLAVVELAIGFLGAARVKQALPALQRLAEQQALAGTPFAARKAAVAALGTVGDPGSVSTLTGLLYTRTWFRRAAGDELRQTAALALLAMTNPEARQVVEAGSRSRRADVRRACSPALQKMAAPAPARE